MSKRAFARHFAEMIVVMLLGMGVLEGLAAVAFAVAGSSLTDQPGALRVTLMGLSMTVPMVFWMRHRGHAAGRNVEMAASMLVPSAIAAALAAASVLSAGAALAVQHAVMVPAMLGVMLWRYEEYARPHAALRGDPPCRAYPNEPATTRVPGPSSMPVLPELEPLLARIRAAGPPERAMPVAQRREQVHAGIDLQQVHMVEPVRALAYVDHRVPVAGGEVAIRVYRPEGEERVGCHLFVHGGGWWMGTLDQSDLACWRVAREVGCAVASVGHRWAPEHRFPVPVEDCYAALEWLATSAAELGLDPGRISVGGISSGANLAAAITLMARDRGRPSIIGQSLEVPILDLTLSTASNDALADGYMLTRERLELEVAGYCDFERRSDPYASPLLAPDLAGLPPALIATAEYDLLRDDGEQYAARLRAAGVPATAVRWPGHLHGSLGMTRLAPSAADWHQRQHAFLRERHGLDRVRGGT